MASRMSFRRRRRSRRRRCCCLVAAGTLTWRLGLTLACLTFLVCAGGLIALSGLARWSPTDGGWSLTYDVGPVGLYEGARQGRDGTTARPLEDGGEGAVDHAIIADAKLGVGGEAPFAFGACLLLKDDNAFLPEWLAYHYTVMPLRYLIVSADKGNITSPEHIFARFRKIGMKIDVWPGEDAKILRQRHEQFRPKCLVRLKEHNFTWTMLIDTDEFVAPNPVKGKEKPWVCSPFKLKTRDETKVQECGDRVWAAHQRGETPRSRLPKLGEVTVADYISNELDKNSLWRTYPCIVFPRAFFGPTNDTGGSFNEMRFHVPYGFNVTSFATLRYNTYQWLGNAGKSFLDASRYEPNTSVGVHIALPKNKDQCNSPRPSPPQDEAVFRVHHYTLAKDIWLLRPTDKRRSEEKYDNLPEVKGPFNNIQVSVPQLWLEAFISKVGKDAAFELTELSRERVFRDFAKVGKELRSRGQNVTSLK